MLRLPQKLLYILSAFLLFLLSLGVIFALPMWYSGFRAEPVETMRVDLRGVYSDCKKVSSSGSEDLFIPTRYAAEWSAFKTNTPTYVSLEDCISGEYVMEIGQDWSKMNFNGESALLKGMYGYSTTITPEFDVYGNTYHVENTNYGGIIKKYSSTGAWILTIGSFQLGDNNLSGTAAILGPIRQIITDSVGDIYVIDARYFKIKKYSSTGAWIYTLGSTKGDIDMGGTDYQFYDPQFISLHSDDSFSVVDGFYFSYSKVLLKVKRYSSGGIFLGTYGTFDKSDNNLSDTSANLNNPVRIFPGDGENIIVDDFGNNKFKTYSATGAWISAFDKNTLEYQSNGYQNNLYGSTPSARSSSGLIVSRDCGGFCLRVYSSTGYLLSQIGSNTGALSDAAYAPYIITNYLSGTSAILPYNYSFALGNDGIYIFKSQANGDDSIQCKIRKYSFTGDWMYDIGKGSVGGPYNVICEDNQLSYGDAGMNPLNMTIDSAGNLYVLSRDWDPTFIKIKKYSSTGTWLMDIGGTPGDNDLSGEDAQISLGWGGLEKERLKLDSEGNIYVFMDRIKKYSSTGAWLLTLGDGTTGGNYLSGRDAGLSYAANGYEGSFLIDNSGSIYVHNGFYFYRKYSSTGAFLFAVGSTGGGPGDNNLSYTSAGISISSLGLTDSANNLYVLDRGNQKIKIYDETGLWKQTIGNKTGYLEMSGLSGTEATIFYASAHNVTYADLVNEYPYLTDSDGLLHFYHCGQIFRYSRTGSIELILGSAYPKDSLQDYCYQPSTHNDLSGTSAAFPYGLEMTKTIDDYGNIWVRGDNVIKKYSSTGAWILNIGGSNGDNELSGPLAQFRGGASYRSSLYSASGNVYVYDDYTKKLKGYTATGSWFLTLGVGISGTEENNLSDSSASFGYMPIFTEEPRFFFDPLGNIIYGKQDGYFSQFIRYKKYSSTGSWISNLGGPLYAIENNDSGTSALIPPPYAYQNIITTDISGNIWINLSKGMYDPNIINYTDMHYLKKYSSTGAYLLTLGGGLEGDNELSGTSAQFTHIIDIHTDYSDNIYVFDDLLKDKTSIKIKKYSSTGSWMQSSVTINQSCYTGDAIVDNSGNTYAYDCDDSVIEKYDTNGNFLFAINDAGSKYSIDDAGNFYISNYSTVKKYDSLGNLLLTIGQEGIFGNNNLSGTYALMNYFYGPTGVDSEGNIYITSSEDETYILRKYSSTGAWIFSKDVSTEGTIHIDKYDNIILGYPSYLFKVYSSLNGDEIATLGGGQREDNSLSGTGAGLGTDQYGSIVEILGKSKEYLLIFSGENHKIKKYIP